MAPRNPRVYLLTALALCALVVLNALVVLWPFVSSAKSASAAPARAAQGGGVLAVNPTILTNCQQCTVVVSDKSPNRSLSWFAFNHGITGVVIRPAGGVLQGGGQVSVSITMPANITCPNNDTITFAGPSNSMNVVWNCTPTPTPSPTPSPTPAPPTPTPVPSPTPTPTPSPTAALSPTPDTSLTPTVTPTPAHAGGGSQNSSNPPTSTSGNSGGGSSVLSIFFSIASLLLALFAFTLYLIPPANATVRTRLLALILPAAMRRPPTQ